MKQGNEIRVLIVEDDIDLQGAYSMILQSQQYIVKTASDGIQAFNALHTFTPDVILLDYLMPRMDGRNFLENFEREKFPHLKIIICSNISDKAVIDSMIAIGADKHVLKSDLSPRDLIELVESMAN